MKSRLTSTTIYLTLGYSTLRYRILQLSNLYVYHTPNMSNALWLYYLSIYSDLNWHSLVDKLVLDLQWYSLCY